MKPIRVLHILHSMNRGGAENAIMNYYREFDRNTVQFDFLLTDSKKCDFEDEIISQGGRIYRVSPLRLSNPLPYIKDVTNFLKKHREYSIIHSHTSSKSVIPLTIAKALRFPVRISHSHNSKSEAGVMGIVRNILKPWLKVSANVYMSCGEQASEWLYGKTYSVTGKVKIIRNVISAEKFRYNKNIRKEIRDKYNISSDTFVVGHVARLCEEKNHRFGLDILKELLRIHPNTIYMIVGEGPLRDDLLSYAKSIKVDHALKMIGLVQNVYDYEQAFDAFILPSFYEGLPLSIIEAQVSGLPCFTTQGTVSSECSVTDLVHYLPLSIGADKWAVEILSHLQDNRVDRYEEIKNAGYDAKNSAASLQNIYLHLATGKS